MRTSRLIRSVETLSELFDGDGLSAASRLAAGSSPFRLAARIAIAWLDGG
jgi:hypothetical protein